MKAAVSNSFEAAFALSYIDVPSAVVPNERRLLSTLNLLTFLSFSDSPPPFTHIMLRLIDFLKQKLYNNLQRKSFFGDFLQIRKGSESA